MFDLPPRFMIGLCCSLAARLPRAIGAPRTTIGRRGLATLGARTQGRGPAADPGPEVSHPTYQGEVKIRRGSNFPPKKLSNLGPSFYPLFSAIRWSFWDLYSTFLSQKCLPALRLKLSIFFSSCVQYVDSLLSMICAESSTANFCFELI